MMFGKQERIVEQCHTKRLVEPVVVDTGEVLGRKGVTLDSAAGMKAVVGRTQSPSLLLVVVENRDCSRCLNHCQEGEGMLCA